MGMEASKNSTIGYRRNGPTLRMTPLQAFPSEDRMKLRRGQSLQTAASAIVLGIILLVGATSEGARSQSTRLIKLVSPTAPGGANNVAARLLADQIGRAEGLTMVVENRPGA